MDRGVWRATVHGAQRVEHDLATKPQQMLDIIVSIIYTAYNTLTYLHTTVNRYYSAEQLTLHRNLKDIKPTNFYV